MAQTNPPRIKFAPVSFGPIKSIDSCDINNDGYDDLIIGASYSDVYDDESEEYATRAGALVIYYGTESIPDFDNPQIITLKSPGINHPWLTITSLYNGSQENRYQFGHRVAAGDFNNDNFCDVIVKGNNYIYRGPGVALSTPRHSYVFFGSASGLETLTIQRLNLKNLDPELWNDSTRFGYEHWSIDSFKAGDFNGDGFDDLLLTHPTQNYVHAKWRDANICRCSIYSTWLSIRNGYSLSKKN